MSHDVGLICCLGAVLVLGALAVLGPLLRVRRQYVARQQIKAARSSAYDGIRRIVDPEGKGLVRGVPDRFFAKIGEVEIEVTQATTRHDADFRPWRAGPMFGAIVNRGDLRVGAAWRNGTGPV